MIAVSPSTVTLLILTPLIAWRVYNRFRRLVGRQRLFRSRLWITLAIYAAFLFLFCFTIRAHPERLAWLAGGLGFGSLLGIFGLSKTRFEPTPEGLFYTPNVHLGLALSLVFIARLAYRLVETSLIAPPAPHSVDGFGRNPLTLVVFGLLAGYYVTYAIGLMRWRLRALRAKRQREMLKREDGTIPQTSSEPAAAGGTIESVNKS